MKVLLINGSPKKNGNTAIALEEMVKVFEKEGVKDNCKLVVTDKAHWWCQDLVWNAINETTKKLGWF